MSKRGIAPQVTFLCAKCRYDLTGATHDVCPACGETFDRAELLEFMGRDPAVWKKIGVILGIAPLACIAFIAASHMLAVAPPTNVAHMVLMTIFAVAAAAPIAAARMVYSEVVFRNRHWSHDSQSKMVLIGAIFTVLVVVEATFMVLSYFVCDMVFSML